jgi:flavorubredoxin
MADVHEIADGIYRIATYVPEIPLVFTQFLIKDEQPLLYHTGNRAMFEQTLESVRKVIDPATLRYISWSHLEADECGATNEFLEVAPEAEPVQGQIGALLSVSDFFTRPVRAMQDGDVLDLGRHKLRFMTTPHVPHAWDAIIAYEEMTGTLLVSDLFTIFGEQRVTCESDLIEPSMQTLAQLPGYLPIGPHTAQVFDRLEALGPKVIAGHHSPTYTGDAVKALRDLRGALFEFSAKQS